jgi:hypothetical protein
VSNPCCLLDAALRAVRMLVHVYPLSLTSTVLRNELIEDPKTRLRRPDEPAHTRWARVASAFPHAAWRATGAYLRAMPCGYGHDRMGRTTALLVGGRVKAVRAAHLHYDVAAVPARVSVLRAVFRAMAGRVRRLAAQQRLVDELIGQQAVAANQGRAFGNAVRLIAEINDVIAIQISAMGKLAAAGAGAGTVVMQWNRAGQESPGYRVLRYLEEAPDYAMRPMSAMLWLMEEERFWLLGSAVDGRWGHEVPRDAAGAFERTPLHLAAGNAGDVGLGILRELLRSATVGRAMAVAVTVDDAFGRKPVHVACASRALVAVQIVVGCPSPLPPPPSPYLLLPGRCADCGGLPTFPLTPALSALCSLLSLAVSLSRPPSFSPISCVASTGCCPHLPWPPALVCFV